MNVALIRGLVYSPTRSLPQISQYQKKKRESLKMVRLDRLYLKE